MTDPINNSNHFWPQGEMSKDFSLAREVIRLQNFYGKVVEHCEMYHREVKNLTARLDETWELVRTSTDTILALKKEIEALETKMSEDRKERPQVQA